VFVAGCAVTDTAFRSPGEPAAVGLGRLPLLVVSDGDDRSTVDTEALNAIIRTLGLVGVQPITATGLVDARSLFHAHPEVGGLLVVWNHRTALRDAPELLEFAQLVRSTRGALPLFLLTQRLSLADLPPELYRLFTGMLWAGEDDDDFLAAHVSTAMADYRNSVLPPFFARLVDYVEQARYAWHTPGHMGGVAFLRSPAGRVFHDFFGERTLRADLSSSVPELGSVLEHNGVVADAERAAARTFGADDTYFVTNGTTMSNQIVFRATVSRGDVVLVDRNCHKSIVNSVIQTGAIPIFLTPLRNRHGMLGPVDPAQLDAASIREKLRTHPLILDADRLIRLAVLTNSTYDGTLYAVDDVITALGGQVEHLLFDEAWIPYAPFDPVFAGRFAMSHPGADGCPTVFATTSTHKMLAAFSQASMIHLRQGATPVPPARFNEAFMMHASTSPQYGIIASLDVAAKMMEGPEGAALMRETVQEAIDFRTEMLRLGAERAARDDWWFTPWQPTAEPSLASEHWSMTDAWTGFTGLTPGYAMLDPTKVSLLCPGVAEDDSPTTLGIPAGLVAALLRERGVVVEKTGFYSVLVLFSIGVTLGKSATLLEELEAVKALFDSDTSVASALPVLFAQNRIRYANVGLRALAAQMHGMLTDTDTATMQEAISAHLPEVAMAPVDAFEALVRGRVDDVAVADLTGRTAAVMCVLYPPGIPVVVPGERFTALLQPVIDYLQLFERWDARFPGFETEMQGVGKHLEPDGQVRYTVPCVSETTTKETDHAR
jgi:arginine decarboxylase